MGLLLNVAAAGSSGVRAPCQHLAAMALRVVIAAGGTAGHVVPALAVADALRAEGARRRLRRGRARRGRARARPPATSCARSRVRGLSRTNPVAAARAAALAARATAAAARILRDERRRRRPGRRRVRRRAGRAGGGRAADPARADRGRQPPRRRQPAARAVRAAGLPRVPARRAATGDEVPRHRAAGAAAGDRPRRGARAVRARRRTSAACSSSAARSARGRSTRRRSRRSPTRRTACCTPPGGATTTRSRRACPAPRYDLRPYIDEFGEALLAVRPRASRARAARSSRSPRTGAPAILVPYPHATADHQTGNARWMERRGRGGRRARRRADARAAARARSTRCCGDPERLARDERGVSARWPGPTRREAIAREVVRRRRPVMIAWGAASSPRCTTGCWPRTEDAGLRDAAPRAARAGARAACSRSARAPG